MSLIIADGTQLSLASAYGTANNTTATSNAASAVFSQSVGHGLVVGDFVEITSAWPGIDGRIARVSVVSTNDITLEGINTSDVNKYPAGTGTGSLRKITTWTALPQITAVATEGGEQQYFDYQFLDQLQQRRVPTSKAPLVLNLTMADDPGLAAVAVLKAAQDAGTPRALRMVFRGGSGATPPRTVLNGYVAFGTLPNIALGQANQRSIAIALYADPTEYNT